jgi:hypothetical protein
MKTSVSFGFRIEMTETKLPFAGFRLLVKNQFPTSNDE